MKEIRTLVGVTLAQLNALFLAVEDVAKLKENDEATLPDCKSCVVSYTKGCDFSLCIKKVQMQKGDKVLFVVQLDIEGDFKYEVYYDESFEMMKLANFDYRSEREFKEAGYPRRKDGVLYAYPAVSSRIGQALGFTELVEPLRVVPKN